MAAYRVAPVWKDFLNVGTGIGNVETERVPSVRIYPNPTKNELKIENGQLKIENEEYRIFNTVGQPVMNGKLLCIDAECPVCTINVSALVSGVYYLKVGGETVKIIKE